MIMSRNIEAYAKIVKCRSLLVLEHPFFGSLSLRMTLKEDPACQTAWSDGKTLAYNPAYVNLLPQAKLKGLLGHLVMHQVCRHHLRRKNREPEQWNMACDYAINWLILESGLTLPDGYLDNRKWRAKTADEIYDLLTAEDNQPESDQKQSVTDQEAEGNQAADADENEPPEKAETRKNETDDEKTTPSRAESENDENTDQRCEQANGDPGNCGEIRDAQAPGGNSENAEDNEAAENEWKIALAQAAMQAKSMGDLPASLARLIENVLSPKLDWRQLLGRFINATARNDYALTPPNRRYLHRGLYLPSMRSEELPEAVVAVDTSGSVSQSELEQFAAELTAIIDECATEVHLLYCDMAVKETRKIHRQDLPLKLTPKGGGGTDFRPAFQWVKRRGMQPRYMVYLTDLACNRFPEKPTYPVLWAHTGQGGFTPPFGEVIELR